MPTPKPSWGELVRTWKDTERKEQDIRPYDTEQLCRMILNEVRIHKDRLFRGKRGKVYETMVETLVARFGHDPVDRILTDDLFWETTLEHAKRS